LFVPGKRGNFPQRIFKQGRHETKCNT
jgi:hypothetical protein